MKQENKFSNDDFVKKSVKHWNLCNSNFEEDYCSYQIFYYQTLNFFYTILESKLKSIFPENLINKKIEMNKKSNLRVHGYMSKFIFFFNKVKKITTNKNDKFKIRIPDNSVKEKIDILNNLRIMRNEITHDFFNKFKSLKINNINIIIDDFDEIIKNTLNLKKYLQ